MIIPYCQSVIFRRPRDFEFLGFAQRCTKTKNPNLVLLHYPEADGRLGEFSLPILECHSRVLA